MGAAARRLAAGLMIGLLMIGLLPVTALASDPLTNHIDGWPQMEDINELTAVVIDADNGGILYSLDRDTPRHPASVTKIMTCLLVLEKTSMTDQVTMGQEALDVAIAGNSNINPILGETFSVEDCLYMLMLKSANDVAVQLAVQVAGSVDSFCAMMNERAAAIGCTGTHFVNPNGLPDPNHVTTAYDIALIMRECLKNPTFRKIIATKSYTVPATNMTAEPRYYENHNRLIDDTGEYYYPYCIGGKTGYTDAAMRTLVAAAEKDGRTLIAVTMGGADRSDFTDMVKLFEYGFNNFSVTRTSDDSGRTGSYTLPASLPPNLTTEEGVADAQGRPVLNYIYDGKIKVGELRSKEEAGTTHVADYSAAPAAPAAADEGSGIDTEESGTSDPQEDSVEENEAGQTAGETEGGLLGFLKPGAESSGPYPSVTVGHRHINRRVLLAAGAALIALIIIICVAVSSHLEKKRRAEARRRRAARKRR